MIDRYEVLSELGRGAMGIVYLARDPRLDRQVVLKTLRREAIPSTDIAEYLARFKREATAAGGLNHPNIVGVHDSGEDDETGEPFLAMEYVAGTTLQALLTARVPLPPIQVAEMMADVADALGFAHEHGIVHRDVKPANLFLGEGNRLKIGDFGVARTSGSTLTATGQAVGTPNYMSPEQLVGDAIDGRSDLFSLGIVAYQLLTCQSPFAGKNFNAVARKILDVQPPSPETVRPEVPGELGSAVMKALAKAPADRYASGREMAIALRRAAGVRKRSLPPSAVTTQPGATLPDPDPATVTDLPARRPPTPSPASPRRATPAVNAPTGNAQHVAAPAFATAPALPSRGGNVLLLAAIVLCTGIALAAAGAVALLLSATPERVEDRSAPTPTIPPDVMQMLAERRYADVERLAEERLVLNPDDAQAARILDLTRAGMRAQAGELPTVSAQAATLAVDLTATSSGRLTVLVDGVPVLEEDFRARASYLFGRPMPGSWRPARGSWTTFVEAGSHPIEVVVTDRSGRNELRRSVTLELPPQGTGRLDIVLSGKKLELEAK